MQRFTTVHRFRAGYLFQLPALTHLYILLLYSVLHSHFVPLSLAFIYCGTRYNFPRLSLYRCCAATLHSVSQSQYNLVV